MLPIIKEPTFTGISEVMKSVNQMFDTFSEKWFEDFRKTGLKKLVNRPHNLYTSKNDKGEIEKLTFECVYTPFKKDELSVSIDGDILNVKCGSENKTELADTTMLFHGISSQSYQFRLPLTDAIDQTNITVHADDGILKIDMPVKI